MTHIIGTGYKCNICACQFDYQSIKLDGKEPEDFKDVPMAVDGRVVCPKCGSNEIMIEYHSDELVTRNQILVWQEEES